MAVQGPWVGSSAVAETGQRWMSTARTVVRLPGAGWMSEMIGRSKEITIDLQANHNYNKDWLIDWMRQQGSTPVVINVRGDLVSYTPGVPLFEFPSNLANEYIQLNNYASMFGRGGTGCGVSQMDGVAARGGDCIHNWVGGRLRIANYGNIGAGGGGGASCYFNGWQPAPGGGGGRPFGAPGYVDTPGIPTGGTGTLTAPGGGAYWVQSRKESFSGAGGDLAQAGGGARTNNASQRAGSPGQPGMALVGGGTTWQVWGSVYGGTQ